MNKLRVIFVLSIIGFLGACAHSGNSEDDEAMRMEKYKQCSAEHPPEKVAEMCGKYLKTN